MKKFFNSFFISIFLTFTSLTTVSAATWLQNEIGWWYQNDDFSYPVNGWYWIDGNNDGIAECYYFDESGYCLISTTTPDGYTVDVNGAWIVNDIVQTQAISTIYNNISDQEIYSESILTTWPGNFPYVPGMNQEKPSGSFWTVNINTGKYHGTANVDRLLPENTRYYPGDAAILEEYGYTRCQKRGCY